MKQLYIIILAIFFLTTGFLNCGAKTGLGWDVELIDGGEGCTSNADCDDGLYCNGQEVCIGGLCYRGEPVECVSDDPLCFEARCDEEQDRCVMIPIGVDQDNDGYYAEPCGLDCDDTNPNINPRHGEECDGVDNDCDGIVDENLYIPCELFGYQECINGEWTDCSPCIECIPGTYRYCDDPLYCTWGIQFCGEDSRWGPCTETTRIPEECQYSFEGYYDEGCCISTGNCCQDFEDRDGDGDYYDSIGNCEGIVCEQ